MFPGTRLGAMMGNVVMTQALRQAGTAASCHGFRSSFRDYAAEQTHTPHAVMEAALAHVVRNKAEAAYARSDLFEKRRALMESWSDVMTEATNDLSQKHGKARVAD